MKKRITGLMVLIAAQSANATIHNVPGDYPDIQTCINFAVNGDECLVAPGTYNESINFIGKAISLRSSGGRNITLIDATGLNDSVVKCISGEGPNTVLEGFTITGGTGIWFFLNSGFKGGGGMYNNNNSSPTVTNCMFSGNTANDPGAGHGGGMFNRTGSNPTVTNCTFLGNSAGGFGGGMYNLGSPTVTNCIFTGNVSSNSGGGMYNNGSDPTVTDCTFNGNSGSGAGGGMLNHSGSDPTVTNCTFNGNTAILGGGMSNSNGSSPTVTNCMFSDNSALGPVSVPHLGVGGGMYTENDGSGGGLTSSPVVTNCTFIGNSCSAVAGGGAIWIANMTAVTSSILWNNTPNQIKSLEQTSVTFSNIQGGWPGQNNINANPLFIDIVNNNYHLRPVSPSVNMGNNTAVTTLLDLDHHARILCDTVDMGAYESGIGDDDCDGDIDLNDFVGFQDCMVEFMLGCEPFDFDGDGDVDLVDFGSLQVLFTN